MSERGSRPDGYAVPYQMLKPRVPRDFPQSDDDAESGQRGHFSIEMIGARDDFLGERPVVRRCTAHGCRNVHIAQLETIVCVMRRRDVCEAGTMERRHQKISGAAGAITGEHAACAIGAVSCGRETEDEHTRIGIAEAGHWSPPVALVTECGALLARNLRAERAESRAALTLDDSGASGDEIRERYRSHLNSMSILNAIAPSSAGETEANRTTITRLSSDQRNHEEHCPNRCEGTRGA